MEPGHEDREYILVRELLMEKDGASMEPGHEDREYQIPCLARERNVVPQWSPVMKTGNTWLLRIS